MKHFRRFLQICIISCTWLWTWTVVRGSKLNIDPDCYVLDSSLPVYQVNNESNRYNVGDVNVGDNGFQIHIRRHSDGVMTDGWFEPGTEYRVELRNKMQGVGFQDYIIWLEPSTMEEEIERTGQSQGMGKQMTEKEIRIKKLESWGKIIRDSNRRSKTDLGMVYESEYQLVVGNWVHLPPIYSLSGLANSPIGITQDRLNCSGLVAEYRLSGIPNKRLGLEQGRTRPVWERAVVNWRAPVNQPNTGIEGNSADSDSNTIRCVAIGATVKTRGRAAGIYSNIGGLRKVFCPVYMRPINPVLPVDLLDGDSGEEQIDTSKKLADKLGGVRDTMQPQDCCACGTASYNLTFQGIWSSQTHPKDWPHDQPGLLHWTNLIGATHSPSFHIYRIGQPANSAVQSVCGYGDITVMKQSLSMTAQINGVSNVPIGSQSGSVGLSPLFSLLNAPGMWSAETLMDSRTVQIAVNRTHPLVSLITMLGPSPDWCTGLSSQSLCRADCTWADNMEFFLYPFDAGFREGNTYIPRNSDRLENPDPIAYITEATNPGNPFTPGVAVAKVTVKRILPKYDWECTNNIAPGVEVFMKDGETKTIMTQEQEMEQKRKIMEAEKNLEEASKNKLINSRESIPRLGQKIRSSINSNHQSAGTAGSGGLGQDNPLNDPALANMATFLCKTDDWSAWSPCSVNCGVGTKTRSRNLIINKKNELCQHLPLVEKESCEGRKRTCDFSAPCSLLAWTEWSPCNATCDDPENGIQSRSRYLARDSDAAFCTHLFETAFEKEKRQIIETRSCRPSEMECDPVTKCGEGRKDGRPCGKSMEMYYYSATDHACLPFPYLGCKGGKNRFETQQACEKICFPAVESLPSWRRERMILLQYHTSQISEVNQDQSKINISVNPVCKEHMDSGHICGGSETAVVSKNLTISWYYCHRTRRCREFVFRGCGGNKNRFQAYDICLNECMPADVEKARRMARAKKVSKLRKTNTQIVSDDEVDQQISGVISNDMLGLVGQKQDCKMSKWSMWGPCSSRCSSEQNSKRWRTRHIMKPARFGGKPCSLMYEEEVCHGQDDC